MNWKNIKIPRIHYLKLLQSTSVFFLVIASLFIFGALFNYLKTPLELSLPEQQTKKISPLKGAFHREKSSYDAIGAPALTLNGEPPRLQLPDLRQLLSYYGTNTRPDVEEEKKRLHLALRGQGPDPQLFSLAPDEKRYLESDFAEGKGRYKLSIENTNTPLWIQAIIGEGNQAEITVHLLSPKGERVTTPSELHTFRLEEKKMPRTRIGSWKLGDDRVDGSLLARQKARWFGRDRFLEEHGGEPYAYTQGKERVEFGVDEERYAVFVGLEDTLVWDEGQWKEAVKGVESWGKPLMQVKRIEDRLMSFEIWDEEGQNHFSLNLIRSRELWRPEVVENDFRFVGARTRTQSIVEIQGVRTTLRPQDWLLRTQNGWIKVETEEAVDDYVERKLEGELFIFDGVDRKEGQQVFLGHVFSSSRHDMQYIELSTQRREAVIYSKQPDPEENDEEDDDEDPEEAEEILRILSNQKQQTSPGERKRAASQASRMQKVLELKGDQ